MHNALFTTGLGHWGWSGWFLQDGPGPVMYSLSDFLGGRMKVPVDLKNIFFPTFYLKTLSLFWLPGEMPVPSLSHHGNEKVF